jgi:hypothetical protein
MNNLGVFEDAYFVIKKSKIMRAIIIFFEKYYNILYQATYLIYYN